MSPPRRVQVFPALSATAEPTPTLISCLAGETGANYPVITERPLLWWVETGWPLGSGQRGPCSAHWAREVGRAPWAGAGPWREGQKFNRMGWQPAPCLGWAPAAPEELCMGVCCCFAVGPRVLPPLGFGGFDCGVCSFIETGSHISRAGFTLSPRMTVPPLILGCHAAALIYLFI